MYKILVIDDDAIVREGLEEILTFGGYNVQKAPDGVVGCKLASEFLPDIILCDIMMPNMDGFEVLQNLRSNPKTFIIPFLFLTAKTRMEDMRFGMELGADDYIMKPFNPEDILNALQTRLDKYARIKEYHEEKMEELKNRIASSIPHELRTPLTIILGYSQYMNKNSEQLNLLDIRSMTDCIYDAGNRLLKLVISYSHYTELLTLESRKEIDAKKETIYPDNIITDAVERLSLEYNRVNDKLLSLNGKPISISEHHFIKAIEELVDNAFKFSESGSKVIIYCDTDNHYLNISITNNGYGMSDEQIQNVGAFSQFKRENFEQQGTGMGLAIVKKTTELYNGKFEIESELNAQTTINISIPLIRR